MALSSVSLPTAGGLHIPSSGICGAFCPERSTPPYPLKICRSHHKSGGAAKPALSLPKGGFRRGRKPAHRIFSAKAAAERRLLPPNLCCVSHQMWLLKFSRRADSSGATFQARDRNQHRDGIGVPPVPSARNHVLFDNSCRAQTPLGVCPSCMESMTSMCMDSMDCMCLRSSL